MTGTPARTGAAAAGRTGTGAAAWLAVRWRTAPGWGQALAVYAASRLLVGFAIARHAALAGERPGGGGYGYLDLVGNWDATWYHRVIEQGYPDVLPRGPDGAVAPNTWAFYPLYPTVVRAVMSVTGAGWPLAATLVSLASGAGAVVLVRSVTARFAGPGPALWTVALLCAFPSTAVLQLPYAESVALLLLVAVLACLQRRSTGAYLAAVPLVLLAGLARPLGVPLAAAVALHGGRRLLDRRRGDGEELTPGRLAALVALGGAAALAAAEWPLAAAVRTGQLSAYTDTMAGWRATRQVRPVEPVLDYAVLTLGSVAGPLAVVVTVVGLVVWLTRPATLATIGGDLRDWCLCYALYLVAVLESVSSLPRYLLPLFPLGTLLVALSPSRAYRVTLTIASAVAGLVWLAVVWRSRGVAP